MNYHVQCFLNWRSVFLDLRHFERDTQAEKSRGISVVNLLFTSPKPSLVFLLFSSPVLSSFPTQGKLWSSSSMAMPVYSAVAGFLGFS